MQVGINYPWKEYGWDFGPPPRHDDGSAFGPRARWRSTIEAELEGFRRLGLFAVRWFLLADGLTYGTGPASPRPDPDAGREGQWRFDEPPPLGAGFEEDFVHLLERFAAAGLLILPCLIDFRFCFPGRSLSSISAYVKQGRQDVVIDRSKRRLFFDRVLGRLLELAAPYREAIYAWELINEPEWCTRDSPLPFLDALHPERTVEAEAMQEFIREGAARINAAGLRSTVGFALYDTLERWDSAALGLTLHQFHYYGEPPELPPHGFDPRWPAIVGELATAPHRPWPELPQAAQGVYPRLAHVAGRGYPAAFLWSASASPEDQEPPAADWSPATQEQVRRFTGGAEHPGAAIS